MPRTITEAMLAALSSPTVKLATFFEAQFSATTLRLWDGTGTLSWAGYEWQGNGWFLNYDPPTETQEIRAEGFRVNLTAVPDEVIALILNEGQQGKPGTVWLAALEDDDSVIEDPVLICTGYFDFPEHSELSNTANMVLSYESVLIDLESANELRLTQAEQMRLFPGDSGFRHVPGLREKRLFWGLPGDIPTR